MKVRKDIQEEIDATLEVASQIARVEPSFTLKGRILQRASGLEIVAVQPFYRRLSFAAAAAAVILAINVVTVAKFLKKEPVATTEVQAVDALDEIRAEYSLEETIN